MAKKLELSQKRGFVRRANLVYSALAALALTLGTPALAGDTLAPLTAPTSAADAQTQAQQLKSKIAEARQALQDVLNTEKPKLEGEESQKWDQQMEWVGTVHNRLGQLGRKISEAPLLKPGAKGSDEETIALMIDFNERFVNLVNKARTEGEAMKPPSSSTRMKKMHDISMSIIRNI